MLRAMLLLVLTTAIAVCGETLEQKLAKRELTLSLRPGQTLSEALAALSADYQAKYHEPLRIFVAVNLVEAAPPAPSSVQAAQKNPEPPPAATDPVSGRTGPGPLRASVIELLRFCANLTNARFTIQGDLVLFHSPGKRAR